MEALGSLISAALLEVLPGRLVAYSGRLVGVEGRTDQGPSRNLFGCVPVDLHGSGGRRDLRLVLGRLEAGFADDAALIATFAFAGRSGCSISVYSSSRALCRFGPEHRCEYCAAFPCVPAGSARFSLPVPARDEARVANGPPFCRWRIRARVEV